ncbi:hypothetical protein ACHAWU_003096 [Discostella pseudostelligera]|uniref:NAD-dependent protein deacetylase n=1 Tax=Discostella pseudostelligera TaxID=259834 RepID=A0ABD3MYN4_9STRA
MLTGTAQIGTMRKLSALLTSLSLVASRAFLQTSSINTKSSSSQSQQRRGPTLSSAAADRITLDKMVESLREGVYEKILVVAGAGISCSAGIPDFRTPGSGLYDNLHEYDLPYPEAIFDIDFYRKNPMPFVTLSKEIWPGVKYRPTITHCFLSLLGKRGILQRIYTQNIDGLEAIAGVNPELLVECHGNFRSSGCIDCGSSYNADDCKSSMVMQGEAPICTSCGGLVKPTIVFFGEVMPNRFSQLVHVDVASCDLVIVLGTSLLVDPVASIPNWVKSDVHRCLINRDVVGSFILNKPTDVFLEGDCDEIVRKLCQLVGWEDELDQIYSHTRATSESNKHV